jgi:hypothetical protein
MNTLNPDAGPLSGSGSEFEQSTLNSLLEKHAEFTSLGYRPTLEQRLRYRLKRSSTCWTWLQVRTLQLLDEIDALQTELYGQ